MVTVPDTIWRLLAKTLRGSGVSDDRLLSAIAQRDWAALLKCKLLKPSAYANAQDYYKHAVVYEMYRKLLVPGDATKRKDAAIATFWAAEAQCAATNARISRFIDNQGPFEPGDESVIRFINVWRKELSRVLGRCVHYLEPAFSGGSTLSDSGLQTTIPDKMSSVPTAYAGTPDYLLLNFRFTPQFERSAPVRVRGNRFFTVPKDTEKDRGCCVEASANVSLQLAVGKILRGLYKQAYKVDLTHAQALHRELAQKASIDGSLATVDLSNASDTISTALLRTLLPRDWWTLLNSLRAKTTEIGGKRVYLSKFSSMGNGFTFELETILFRSLCAALGAREAYTFGDDIIIESSRAPDLLAALRFFGFTPNERKTFCEGPFRESCGGDYFDGQAVRPYYIKELPDEPQKWMAIANGIRRCDPELSWLHAAWRYSVDQIPIDLRLYGPSDLGDLVIWDPEAKPVLREYDTITNGVRYRNSPAYFWRVYRPVQLQFELGKHFTYRVATAAASLGVPELVSPRDAIRGYRKDWVAAHGVTGTGGWCG